MHWQRDVSEIAPARLDCDCDYDEMTIRLLPIVQKIYIRDDLSAVAIYFGLQPWACSLCTSSLTFSLHRNSGHARNLEDDEISTGFVVLGFLGLLASPWVGI